MFLGFIFVVLGFIVLNYDDEESVIPFLVFGAIGLVCFGFGLTLENMGEETQVKTIMNVTENNNILPREIYLEKGVWKIEKIEHRYPWYATDNNTTYRIIGKVDSNTNTPEKPNDVEKKLKKCEEEKALYEKVIINFTEK